MRTLFAGAMIGVTCAFGCSLPELPEGDRSTPKTNVPKPDASDGAVVARTEDAGHSEAHEPSTSTDAGRGASPAEDGGTGQPIRDDAGTDQPIHDDAGTPVTPTPPSTNPITLPTPPHVISLTRFGEKPCVLAGGAVSCGSPLTAVPGMTSGIRAFSGWGSRYYDDVYQPPPRYTSSRSSLCAVTDAGSVVCVGEGYDGYVQKGGPVTITGMTQGYVAVAAGSRHACALASTGSVACWRPPLQVTDYTATVAMRPLRVIGATSGIVAITAGTFHTCALTDTGRVKCWGANLQGQLGTNDRVDSEEAVDIPGLSDVSSIAAGGEQTCAILKNGTVRCWGAPVAVPAIAGGASYVAVSPSHACAVVSGALQCWGKTPVATLPSLTGVTAVVAMGDSTCAFANDALTCWGRIR